MKDFLYIILELLLSAPTVLIALSFHECAHAFVADKLGDHTAKYMGRLTLNPLKHFDPFGALCMLLCGFGWARAVPVNMMNFRKPKRDMAFTALAGPATNLILGFTGCFLYSLSGFLIPPLEYNSVIYWIAFVWLMFLYYFAYLNIFLAIFNLIPAPPFDGSRILGAFLKDRHYIKLLSYERYIGLAFFAIYFIDARLDGPISTAVTFVVNGCFNGFNSLFYLLFNLFV